MRSVQRLDLVDQVAADKGRADVEVVVQHDNVRVRADLQGALAVPQAQHLRRMQRRRLDGLHGAALCKLPKVADTLRQRRHTGRIPPKRVRRPV